MEQYDIKKTSAELATSAGIGVTAVLFVVILSLQQAFPPAWMALGCALFGLAVRQLAYFLLVPWYMSHYRERDISEPGPDIQVVVPDEPKWLVVPSWFEHTNWQAIINYLRREEQPVLSRRAMLPYVNQRTYSPLGGEQSFPEFMVMIGAARREGSNYEWLPDAALTVAKLIGAATPALPGKHETGYVTS